jgi:hypothetical protein
MGHEQSCGVSIPINNIQALVDYYNTLELSYEPHIDVLQSYSINDIPNYIYNVFDASTDVLWGHNIPKPLFEVHDIVIYPNDIQILGGNKRTLKMFCNGLSILIFNATKQNKKDLGIEDINNPKTGVLDVITILFTGMIISLGGFFLVKKYNERYEM